MKRLIEWLTVVIPFLADYPGWVKTVIGMWILFGACVIVLLLFFRKPATEPQKPSITAASDSGATTIEPPAPAAAPPPRPSRKRATAKAKPDDGKQTVRVSGSPDAVIYQAGRDIVVGTRDAEKSTISSLTLEARLTFTTKPGVELPPEKLDVMLSGGDAAFEAPSGTFLLKLSSPIYFLRQNPDRVVVVNRFSLAEDSPLRFRPIRSLETLELLTLPVVTGFSQQSAALDRLRLLELSMRVNGSDPDYQMFKYDLPFEPGKALQISMNPARN